MSACCNESQLLELDQEAPTTLSATTPICETDYYLSLLILRFLARQDTMVCVCVCMYVYTQVCQSHETE